MNRPRKVKFKTKIALLKIKPLQAFLGTYFIAASIFMTGVTLLITRAIVDSTLPKIDYQEVTRRGTMIKGTITDIDVHSNISENGQHPATISYKYRVNNDVVESKYQILSPEEINQMNIGDPIDLKYLNNASAIAGFKPYTFSLEAFDAGVLPLFFIGILLMVAVISRFIKNLNLYKYGRVSDAKLISIASKSASRLFALEQRVLVHYQYKTSNGLSVLGETLTADLSILNQKKQGDAIKIFVSEVDESKSCYIPNLEAIRNDWNIEGI